MTPTQNLSTLTSFSESVSFPERRVAVDDSFDERYQKVPLLVGKLQIAELFSVDRHQILGSEPTGRLLVEYGNRFAITDMLLKLARAVVSKGSAGWESQKGAPNWCRVSVPVSVVRLESMDGELGDVGTRLSLVGS